MDYRALKAEIAGDAYKGLSVAEIVAALNAETVPTIRDVPTSEAKNVLRLTGEWGAVVLLSRQVVALDDPAAQAVAMAITVVDTLTETTRLGTTDAAHWQAMQVMVEGLRGGGVISDDSAAALLALRAATTSRAAQLGLPPVDGEAVKTARLIDG